MDISVEKAGKINGSIRMPGDKSIAHRALILGSLARGKQRVLGLPPSEDVRSTLSCLTELGCTIDPGPSGSVTLRGGTWNQDRTLDAGNSGTTTRLLAGLVAGLGLRCTLDGDRSLRTRPMKRIAEPLGRMGAKVQLNPAGCLPLRIEAGDLQGVAYAPPVASAQVKSAVLIAGLNAAGETTVTETHQTRDHTENLLAAMGASPNIEGLSVSVRGGSRLEGIEVAVPGDVSSALFFLAAAVLLPGSEIRLPGTGVNPTRTGALTVLQEMGADLELSERSSSGGEPIATLVARSSSLNAVTIEGALIPLLIDELPLLAVLATQAQGTTRVRDAGELRFKESDRIKTTVASLSRLGADVEERPDGFRVHGPTPLMGAPIQAQGDHRIAMAMGVAGLIAQGRTVIQGGEAAAVSYPDFFADLRGLIS